MIEHYYMWLLQRESPIVSHCFGTLLKGIVFDEPRKQCRF